MLSNLYDQTFTMINQIPASQDNPAKTAWTKRLLAGCDKVDGIYDKSSGGIVFKSSAFTVYCKDWEKYRAPLFTADGYYSLYRSDETLYTANIGDLILFAAVDDPAPASVAEFNALRDKYRNCGGVITACECYINYKPDGTPWRTNHIEIVKG